jgi:hypothetical protein
MIAPMSCIEGPERDLEGRVRQWLGGKRVGGWKVARL